MRFALRIGRDQYRARSLVDGNRHNILPRLTPLRENGAHQFSELIPAEQRTRGSWLKSAAAHPPRVPKAD
jgi:hypothetical protein